MFRYETELAGPVKSWLKSQGAVCVAEEVEIGYGIPDLIAGVGSVQRLRNRRRQADPVASTVQLSLLEFCRVTRSIAELREWAPNGFSGLKKRALLPLLERELVAENANGFRTRRLPRDPFERLIAVEMKLRATQRGFAQANVYRLYAEASYLAIPAKRIDSVQMDKARHLGIGLLAVHESFCDAVVEPASEDFTTPGRRRLASEQVLIAHGRSDGRVAGSPMVQKQVS